MLAASGSLESDVNQLDEDGTWLAFVTARTRFDDDDGQRGLGDD